MICPKYKQDQDGNFCGYCGNQLKQRCPECKKVEPIGRKVCLSALSTAKEELRIYLENKVWHWRCKGCVLFALPFCLDFCVAAVFLLLKAFGPPPILPKVWWSDWRVVSPLGIAALLIYWKVYFFGFRWQERAVEEARKEFFQLHSNYAELIKKAEGK